MSSPEFGGFEPKSARELREQFRTVDNVVTGGDKESSLLPPSAKEKDVLKMSEEEIKNTWPYRYEMYLRLVREMQKFRSEELPEGENQMSQEELDEMKKWLTALNSLDRYITNHREGNGEATLRDRQFTVFEDIRTFLEHGGTEGYVKLPTGVGKTVLFTELIEALNLRTLIVVPTTLLISQTQDKINQFASGLEVGKIYSDAKEYGRQVTIITYDSFVSHLKSNKINPDDFDCLILDEVHTSLSEQKMKAVHGFDSVLKIGFTATPDFSSRKKTSDLLGTEIHRMEIREAVEEGLLSPLSAVIAKTEVDLSNVRINKHGDYDQENLSKAVNVAGRNKAAVELYQKNFNNELAIAYCVGVKHAQAVADKFNQEGIPAAHISGEMSPKVQEAILAKFHKEEIKILCNADLLIAGFDEPKVSICLNLRPTKSRVVAEQRGGRVIRLDPNNPNKHASIIDFLDNGIDPGQKPVLFASVIEGMELKSRSRRAGETGEGGDHRQIPIIDVPGLKILTDMEEVMRVVKEKTRAFDVSNPDRIRELLLSTKSAEELKSIGFWEFRNTSFGKLGVKGGTLLRNFGTKEENLANLKALIEFSGLERHGEFDINDTKQLKDLLLSTKSEEELSNIGFTEFFKTIFKMGGIRRSGQYLLTAFGSFRPNTENMFALLKSIGVTRDKESFDFTDKKQLTDLLLSAKSIEELKRITTEEFLTVTFEHGKVKRTGFSILSNFGSKKTTRSNLLALLEFTGIKTERLDIGDKVQLKKLLLSAKTEEQLKNISVVDFNSTKFKLGDIETTGHILLATFNKGFISQALDDLLNFAGIERERYADLADPKKLKALLLTAKTEAELNEVMFTDFNTTIFAKGTMGEMRGDTLLKRFAKKGSKSLNTETMLELLKFAGIERDDFDINDPQKVRDLLLSTVGEDELKQIGIFKFRSVLFKDKRAQYVGSSLLKKFGSKGNNNENMQALLNFAGIKRDK